MILIFSRTNIRDETRLIPTRCFILLFIRLVWLLAGLIYLRAHASSYTRAIFPREFVTEQKKKDASTTAITSRVEVRFYRRLPRQDFISWLFRHPPPRLPSRYPWKKILLERVREPVVSIFRHSARFPARFHPRLSAILAPFLLSTVFSRNCVWEEPMSLLSVLDHARIPNRV